MLIFDLNRLNQLVVDNIPRIRKIPFDVIVHVPRSGTIPASLLATYIGKPFCSLEEFCHGDSFVYTRKSDYESLNRILLVDDSIRTGAQMKNAVDKIREHRPDASIKTLSVFSTKFSERVFNPDLFLHEHDECEYIYPWFMWKTKRIGQCAVDMDGVLCADCPKELDDDGNGYKEFLKTASMKFKTRYPIGAIVTSRLEKYRPETETWLKTNGYKYRKLIMGPWKSKEDRRGKSGAWKAQVYSKLPHTLFIESSARDSEQIARTGKKVWCVDNQRVY